MALKDEVRGIATDLEDVLSRAGEIVLDNGLGALTSELHDIATRAGALADAVADQMDEVMHKVRFENDEDATDDGMPDWEADHLPDGAQVGRTSMDGENLRVGDRVQVYDSERYGDPTAVVVGPGPNHGDGKLRVCVALDDGRDDCYTPSTGRVRRLPASESGDSVLVRVPEASVTIAGYTFVIRTHVRVVRPQLRRVA